MSEALALTDVTVMRDGATVLQRVTMDLAPGERLAIIGPNGAGKTTLLRTIVGLQRITSGRVRLLGSDCAEEKQFRAMRPRVGFLFQDSDDQLFCPTVIEDVAFGPLNAGHTQSAAMARAEDVLGVFGIGHLAGRITNKLSGGEKRLVCLAGLFAMSPEILLLDEPTNGVDAANLDRLRAALRVFAGAMILVSHDADFVAEWASGALILADGKLLPAEVHTHPHLHSHPHVHPVTG